MNPLGPILPSIRPIVRISQYEAVSFAYACRLLHGVRLPLTDPQGRPLLVRDPAWPLTVVLRRPLLDDDPLPLTNAVRVARLHAAANQAAGCLAAHFWFSWAHRRPEFRARTAFPPNLARIPFLDPDHLTLDHLPRPFGADLPGAFPRFHLEHMTRAGFLADGGAWTLLLWNGTAALARAGEPALPPSAARLRGLRAGSRGSSIVWLRAPRTRVGPHAQLELAGALCRRRGTAHLTMVLARDDGSRSEDVRCHAVMTPFGLVGNWVGGRAERDRTWGWMWMFKSAWAADAPPIEMPREA